MLGLMFFSTLCAFAHDIEEQDKKELQP